MAGIQNQSYDTSDSTHQGRLSSKVPSAGATRSVQADEEGGGEGSTCGWGPFKPTCLQCCNKPAGFLVFICIFGLIQGMTINGFVFVVTTTLERRFNIPSIQSGFISSSYDFGTLIVVTFVAYFGEKAHKPVWLGVGALGFACGSVLFTVPHYLAGLYQFESVDIPTCHLNNTNITGSSELESGLSRYYVIFIIAQLIHGISASGLYTLGYTYLDENTPASRSSMYIGIFQASSLLGPACGYLIGGILLEIYTDISVDTSTLEITSDSPLWIGAWWIGFLLSASLAFLVAFPLLAFPRSLPGNKKKERRVSEVQKGAEFTPQSGLNSSVKDFPKAIWCLIKNLPYLFLTFGTITEWFLLGSFATFGPKYLETQFSLTASDAALLSGYIVIPAGLFGTVVGGVLVSKLKLHFRGMLRLTLISLFISLLTIPSFLISCDVPKVAGVTVQYENTSLAFEGVNVMLDSTCNTNCGCGSAFDPVCGSNGILYYTPCHAGCDVINTTSSVKAYSNCSCIESPGYGQPSSVVSGKCPQECNFQIVFIIMFLLLLIFMLMATVPVTIATMRCVSQNQRSFALGFQSVLFRAFGTIPGPVVYGALIDRTCILWEEDDSGGRQCWQYDNAAFSQTSLILALILRGLSLIFFTVCLCVYKPDPNGNDPGAEVEPGVKNAKVTNGDFDNRAEQNEYQTKL